jgi:hypothetical protein
VNSLTVHRQWATRPPDERFRSFDELEAAVATRRHASSVATWLPENIRVRPDAAGDLVVTGGQVLHGARFSNWTFGQTCRLVGAPADFVGELPANLAADVLTHLLGQRREKHSDPLQVLIQDVPGQAPVLRAVTSEKYSRAIWDLDVVQMVRKLIDGTSFRNPLAFAGGKFGGEVEPGGLYASDRDVFLTVWDEDHPIEVGDERFHRFALFWNSETGARTFGATLGLVRTICRNLILWGARDLIDIRLRHVGAIDLKVADEVPRILAALAVSDPSRERQVIQAAIGSQVAKNTTEAIVWLRDRGFSGRVARAAVSLADQEEGGAGTIWQLVQGVTAHARSIPYRDQRAALERQAGGLLALAA